MATPERAKPRARRIAADEAHAWARNLRLNNPHAKLTLSMVSLYVDGDGYCFVSIPTLADDTELSTQTVRNRLAWLEQVGAITRLPQWIDEYGRRNGEAKGKRTSDLIRLMLDVDPEVIEAAVRGDLDAVSREVSPMPQTGLNPVPETVSPMPALRQPYDSVEGLISEPEPESPLKPPQGGEREPSPGLDQGEPEHFGPAWEAWPGHQAMRRDLALEAFRQLTPEQQRHCRAAIAPYLQMRKQIGRSTVPDFHRWIRVRGFDEFPNASLEPAPSGLASYEVSSREGRALKELYRFARVPLFETGGRVVYPLPVTARVLAFAELPPERDWPFIESEAQLAAWSAFLTTHLHRPRANLVQQRGDKRGFAAPWAWPPRRDGTISPVGEQQGEQAE
jgi:hypothetical protein